mgnify:CR=1 FL=1
MVNFDQWNGFKGRLWKEEINVRDFVQNNYKPYDGDESFLEGPTEATNKLWGRLQELQKEERAKGGTIRIIENTNTYPAVLFPLTSSIIYAAKSTIDIIK